MLIIEMKNIEILENLKSFEKQKCRSINFFFTNNPNSLRIILLFLSNYNSSKKKSIILSR